MTSKYDDLVEMGKNQHSEDHSHFIGTYFPLEISHDMTGMAHCTGKGRITRGYNAGVLYNIPDK
jgi:hypothetical protein